jgi:hypothetical protein
VRTSEAIRNPKSPKVRTSEAIHNPKSLSIYFGRFFSFAFGCAGETPPTPRNFSNF